MSSHRSKKNIFKLYLFVKSRTSINHFVSQKHAARYINNFSNFFGECFCISPKKFSPKCKDAKLARITAELKKLILDTHNGYRNKVAGGQLPNFEPAREMIAMV